MRPPHRADRLYFRPKRAGVKRRDQSERQERPCLSAASWDATASAGLEVARPVKP
ncbi:hypothetical protein [Parabacteroides distasonis]|uniref:hypothetical protein n=1 Tax=Parabacteroides distasonis TaxID=823 RepID=UPI001F3177DB|nr:hypothetical protein [Parabacteroides distasonis]MCE9061007.1 hypothetical protein [Parabacteroides distasonis]